MRVFRKASRVLATIALLVAATGASATANSLSVSAGSEAVVLARTLRSSNATEAAAAAYWLGFKGKAAVPQIPHLIASLGDKRPARPSVYRRDASPGSHSTPGQEAAGALARIGRPAVDPLIQALRSSSSSFARQNAAWALGQIDSAERDASASNPRSRLDRED